MPSPTIPFGVVTSSAGGCAHMATEVVKRWKRDMMTDRNEPRGADDATSRPELPHRVAGEIPPPAEVIERPPLDVYQRVAVAVADWGRR